jgi:hypothetical protein
MVFMTDEPDRDRVEHAEPVGLSPPGPLGLLLIIGGEPREALGYFSGDRESCRAVVGTHSAADGRRNVRPDLEPRLSAGDGDRPHKLPQLAARFALGELGQLDGKHVWAIAIDPLLEDPLGLASHFVSAHPGVPDVLHLDPDEFIADEDGDTHVTDTGIDGEVRVVAVRHVVITEVEDVPETGSVEMCEPPGHGNQAPAFLSPRASILA